MHDSSRGIVIEKLGVGSCAEKPPIWKSEKPHGSQVFHCASEAAIFIPCALVTASPKRLPTTAGAASPARRRSARASPPGGRASTLRPRRKCQQQTPSTTIDAEDQPGEDRVQARAQREVVRQQRPDARQLRLAVDDLVADRVLHPRVGHEDEVRRQPGAERDDPDRRQVQRAATAGSSRRSTARGTSPRARTRPGPRSPAARRTRRRRSSSTPTSSSRTGTPARGRSRRRSRS